MSCTHAENEEELDEHGTKRQDPSHQDSVKEKACLNSKVQILHWSHWPSKWLLKTLTLQTCSCTSAALEPAEGFGWCALGYHMAVCGSQNSSPGTPRAWRCRTTYTAGPALWWRGPEVVKEESGNTKRIVKTQEKFNTPCWANDVKITTWS